MGICRWLMMGDLERESYLDFLVLSRHSHQQTSQRPVRPAYDDLRNTGLLGIV
jgi:hypothetical protein